MSKPLQFKTGSLIYIKGDKASHVYILQKGKVDLIYEDIETNIDKCDLVQQGEFFGVKSALGRYPREENAVVLQDALVLAFTVQEFEALAMTNPRIIMKMLKVFSNQLRRVHHQVISLMEGVEQHPETGLFTTGQHYLNNKRFNEARYVFKRYLELYPSGRYSNEAIKNLENSAMLMAKSRTASIKPSAQGGAAAGSDVTIDASKTFKNALGLMSEESYQQACLEFKKVIDYGNDQMFAAKSSFEIGRCLFLMQKYEESIKGFTIMITQYPKHPDLPNALFYIGQSHEKQGRKEQAAVFYSKILSMIGDQDAELSGNVKSAISRLKGE